jgi:hypothetical protein
MTALLPVGTSQAVLRRIAPSPESVRVRDPVEWVQGQLGEFLWSKQREILASLQANRKTAVQSAHGIGKSFVASRAVAWWIGAHPPGEAMVVSSAPSAHQTRAILWGELAKAHYKGGLPGFITRGQVPEWVIDGQVVGFGRKPPDAVDENEARVQFQGIHARYLLVVLDEAGGVPKWLWEAAGTLATNEASRILAIGNPDDPTSHFAKVCAPGSGYNVLRVSAFDTPNFTGEPVPQMLTDSLTGSTYVQDAKQEWGEESPLYISKVLGEFPEVSDDVILSPRLIREAHERDLSGRAILDQGRYGLDIARQGKDESCIYENRGGMIRLVQAWRVPDLTVTEDKVRAVLKRNIYKPMLIDVPGMGYGVHDHLRREGFRVTPFNGGETAHDPNRFADRNAEAWWGFRESLQAGLIDLDPDDDLLAAQLQSRRWSLDASQRRIKIEKKDDMAKRGLKSPDRADAAILAWYEGCSVPDPGVVMAEDDGSITGDLMAMQT